MKVGFDDMQSVKDSMMTIRDEAGSFTERGGEIAKKNKLQTVTDMDPQMVTKKVL